MMTKDIFDPDIQDAPVYPVSFMIQNQEHLNEYPTYDFADPQIELTKDGNIDFQLFCTIFLDKEFIENFKNVDNFIYLNVLSTNDQQQEIYLVQQKGDFPLDQGNLITYSFHVVINEENVKKFKLSYLKLQLAITQKHEREMGISESIRLGRFLNTVIPIKK